MSGPGEGARLVLVRHGQTDYNRDGRLQGQIDIPLNETGLAQARAAGRSIALDPPDLILSSPLERARVTAETIAEACGGLEVTTDDAFLERGFGRWEGLTGTQIQEGWPEEYLEWRSHRAVHGVDVEPRSDVAERVSAAARALLSAHPGRTVMVVGHGAATTLGITALLGLDGESFRGIAGLDNCARSVLEPLSSDPSGQLMRLLSHNRAPDFP